MVCPKIWVKCTKCKRIFLRYRYGSGKYRVKHYKKKEWADGSNCHILHSCINCRGAVEEIQKPY